MSRNLCLSIACSFSLAAVADTAQADLTPDWISYLPSGSSLLAGFQDMVVDSNGITYVTGAHGSSSNLDILTAAFGTDGALLWSASYDGTEQWHDQARGIALAPGGVVLVCGNTPNSGSYANVLVLAYDAGTGQLLDSVQYSSGASTSEAGTAIVADRQGNVFVGGTTVGEDGDALILKFDSDLNLLWKRVWDGPALAPYSQDSVQQIQLSPAEEPVVLIHGVMASNHPDYVVVKYAPADGSKTWQAAWGSNGEDSPSDMVIDPGSDVLVTGTAIHGTNQFSTIRLRGSDGSLLWQQYDSAAARDSATALALDENGGVYITGRVDPDGDRSNSNDNIYTVKRDALNGAFRWSHLYGLNAVGNFDVPSDVIVDQDGHVFVAGRTNSPPYNNDTITLVLDSGTGLETDRGIVSGSSTQMANPEELAFDSAQRLLVGGETYDFNSGEIQISVFRYPSLIGRDGQFIDLGGGLAGQYAPRLDGSGSLRANGSFTLFLTQLPPATSGPLFVGFALWNQPFKGGILLPTPDLILFLATRNGAFDLPGSMPPGVPSRFSLYLQAWFPDTGAPQGLCATNGLELITPQ